MEGGETMKKKITASVTALSILAFGALTLNASSTDGGAQVARSTIKVQLESTNPSASAETPEAWIVSAARAAWSVASNAVRANSDALRNASIYGNFVFGTEVNQANVGDTEQVFDK